MFLYCTHFFFWQFFHHFQITYNLFAICVFRQNSQSPPMLIHRCHLATFNFVWYYVSSCFVSGYLGKKWDKFWTSDYCLSNLWDEIAIACCFFSFSSPNNYKIYLTCVRFSCNDGNDFYAIKPNNYRCILRHINVFLYYIYIYI